MVPTITVPSPVDGSTLTNSYPGGIGSPPMTCSTTVGMTSPSVQMMSSTTNQVAVSAVPHPPLSKSMSVQNMRELEHPRHHPPSLPHPLPPSHSPRAHLHNRSCDPPPSSPPISPPPSTSVTPHHKNRRHSTHSLQEQVLRTQLEGTNTPPNTSLPYPAALPLCGLPTSPPHNINKPRPQSANVNVPPSLSRPTSMAVGSSNQATKPVQSSPRYSLSGHHSSQQLSHVTRRGHARSKSSGTFPTGTHVPPTAGRKQQFCGHHVSSNDLGDTPQLSKSSVSLSSTFIFDSHPSKAPPPNPQKGYDFSKHFSLFSPFTSNMALEYCQGQSSPELQECPPPPVWCMDVWNDSIVVGCGNGQIEVGVVFSHMTQPFMLFTLAWCDNSGIH